jgi:hypothetical protein
LLLSTVDLVFELPVLSIAMVASRLRVTPRSAALNVGKLVDAGILVETTGRARGRFFMARRVIEIVEGRSGTSA